MFDVFNLPLSFLYPQYLWAFPIILGLLFWIEKRAQSSTEAVHMRGSPWRKNFARGLRLLFVAVITAALAGLCVVREDRTFSVIFCLDRSASMERARQEWALDWIRSAVAGMGEDDRAALLVFGGDASLEVPLQKRLEVLEPRALVDREFTNLAAALRLAQAHFPAHSQRKIVLLSDGNENLGQGMVEVAAARAANIPITTVFCETTPSKSEVFLEELLAPEHVEKNAPFSLRVTIMSRKAQKARLILQHKNTVETIPLELEAGRNTLEWPQRLSEADTHIFKARVEIEDGEDNPLNNESYALTEVRGKTRVLILDREPKLVQGLADILTRNGFLVTLGDASAMPVTRAELSRYEVIVLSDIPATAWSRSQLDALEAFVRDLGGGLAMLGGQEGFGLGGYFGTAVARVLPVDCDLRNKKNLPTMSLVFCLDRSGSMASRSSGPSKLDLAKEGVRRTLDLLHPKDRVGIIGFDSSASWHFPLNTVDKKSQVEEALGTMYPGGGTNICPALIEAHNVLAKSDSELKHLILLTDGRSQQGDYETVMADCRRDKISVSCVGIGEEADKDLLTWIAQTGQGRVFLAKDASELPRIFTKDTLTASRSLLVEKDFRPAIKADADLIDELSDWPELHGFVLTTARERAELILASNPGLEGKDDGPILARWRVGLGKSLALTTDLKGRWSSDWLTWPDLEKLWLRSIQWLRKDRRDGRMSVRVEWRHGQGQIQVENHQEGDDAFQSGLQGTSLDLKAHIVGPPQSPNMDPVSLRPTGPGRYEGAFPAGKTGVYFLTVGEQDSQGREQILASRGFVFPYSREYRELQARPNVLERISQLSGGQVLNVEQSPPKLFKRTQAPLRSSQEIWPFLIALAVALWVLDVGLRRVDVRSVWSQLFSSNKGPSKEDGEIFDKLMDRKKSFKRKLERRSESDRLREAAASVSPMAVLKSPEAKAPEPAKPNPKTSPKTSSKPAPKAQPRRPVVEGDYTSRLLAAKKRAREERKNEGR